MPKYFSGLFGEQIDPGADYTQQAVDALAVKGISDPRLFNPNMTFLGTAPESKLGDSQFSDAFVRLANPNQVNLVKPNFRNAYTSPLDVDTLAHEVEHSLAYTGGSQLGSLGTKTRGDVFVKNYNALKGFDPRSNEYSAQPLLDFYNRATQPEIGSYLKKNYGFDPTYIGSNKKSQSNPIFYEELASDLGAAAKIGKKNIFEDSYLQKNLFNNDPELMEAVRSTLYVEPRMDARDLQRLTAYPENVDTFKKMLKKSNGGSVDKTIQGNSKLI